MNKVRCQLMMHDFIRYGYIWHIGVRVWVHTSDRGKLRIRNRRLRVVVEVVVVVEVAEVVEVVVHPESK